MGVAVLRAVGVHDPFKSSVTGSSLLATAISKTNFTKNQGDPLPP